jgi:hypothetical protein
MSGRKRLKKYNAGGATMGMNPLQGGLSQFGAAAGDFWKTEDMRDGELSKGGALGSGALKGASMGAALGPWGAAAGAVIGGAVGLMNRHDINKQMEAEAEAKRLADEQQKFMLEQQEKAATDAILENYPVKGVAQPRFAMGGDTDPKKKKNTIWDAPLNAKRLAMHDKVLPALTKLNEDEITMMIDKSIEMDNMFKGLSGKEKLAAFKQMDMSWVKPLREKTGLSKSEIIDAAGDSGAIKQWAVGPVKFASKFMDFKLGGSTVPQYRAEGGEMIQHQSTDVPRTDNNGDLNRMTATEAEITGDKHSAASGGVGMSDKNGARIYSDQLTADKDLVAKLMKL